ncbi:MAG: ABC transporter ATP-binding protein [Ignavibacteria bacterium]
MSNIEIVCQNISKSFSGKNVFVNLSFKISSGKSLSITGKNGSGKSTLIKIIANLLNPTKGDIKIYNNGLNIPKENWYLSTGLISPYINLYDELTGFENLDFFYKLKSQKSFIESEIIDHLLNEVNLYDRKNEYLKNYSSGMKQRLKLAFALINNPPILLMDEPGSNLDNEGIELIKKVSRLQMQRGILLIATNDEKDKELCENSINIEEYKNA